MGVILKNKLKALKEEIRVWNKIEYGDVNTKVDKLIVEIAELDVHGEIGLLSSEDVEVRKKKFEAMWRLLRSKDASIFQRSKSKWLKEGDANSKYFHRCVKARATRNSLKAINVDGVWVESPTDVRQVVVDYFRNHMAKSYWERPTLDGVDFAMLSEEDNMELIAPFSLLEIEEVIKTSDGNKSSGPDGFNFVFFKEFWYLLKHEIRILFDQFHANEVIPKSFVSFFVTLIPKVNALMSLNQYRPISLLGSLYKLLAKVLAKRLSKVMNSIISVSQSTFLKGRHLVDGVLIVNEVVDLAKRANQECLIIKVDFEKTYDSVNWGFLEYMMRRVGIEAKWVRWIKACVFGGNMSILVNGSPTKEISVQRGLKQGDPLAPFLFLLVAEGFSGLMTNAVNRNLFKGFEVKRGGMVVFHLQYADDTLCIGEPTVDNLWLLKAVLRGFEMALGLKVNFHKSSLIGVNVQKDFMEAACNFLHCREGAIPFKYLGLPVGANSRKLSTWEPMLDQLKKRLNSWENKYVSLGGRIVLNSVLNAIPIFYLSFLKIPTKVLKMVTRIQREFLWGGVRGGRKVCWVKWRKVCQPRSNGGLGVRDVKLVNLSLLAKWKWRLLQEEQPLWKRVLVDKYGDHVRGLASGEGVRWPRFTSLWWRNLMSLDEGFGGYWFTDRVRRKIGNGMLTSFWKDGWMGEVPFYNLIPRLYSL